jgi:hypothetical protein
LITLGSFSTTNESSTIASLGARRSDWGDGFDRPLNTISIAPTVTRVWGAHTPRAGYDFRWQRWAITNHGYPGGRFQFNGAYTRLNNSAPTNDRAQSWAQFLLGLPTAATGVVATPGTQSSQFEISSPGEFTQVYHHLFVQDDWRITRRLTANLGLRLEINSGMSEIDNRNLAGLDTATSNPIEAAAMAAYALSPIPSCRRRSSTSRAVCSLPMVRSTGRQPSSCLERRRRTRSTIARCCVAVLDCSRTTTSSRTSTRPGSRRRRLS